MSKDFQTIFNQAKGSIPARLDVDLSKGFNPCQEKSQQDLNDSIKAGTLGAELCSQYDYPAEVSRRGDGSDHGIRQYAQPIGG